MGARRGAVGRSSWWIAVLVAGIGGACGEPTRAEDEPTQPAGELAAGSGATRGEGTRAEDEPAQPPSELAAEIGAARGGATRPEDEPTQPASALATGIGGASAEPTRAEDEPAQTPIERRPLVGDPRDVLVVTRREWRHRDGRVRTLGGIELPDDVVDAAYVGTRGELVVVVSGPRSHLAIARDVAHVAGARVLEATAIESTLPIEWEWEIHPNGRSICVHRAASRSVYWPHGAQPEALPEIARVAWLAIVPLDGRAARTLRVDGLEGIRDVEILGWSRGRCVVGLDSSSPMDRTLAFRPDRPRDPDLLVSAPARLRELSPRGTMAVDFNGSEREDITTLHRLGAAGGAGRIGRTRELQRGVGMRHVAGYAWVARAAVTYAPDDAWIAVHRTEWRAPRFEVTLRVESPDGSRVLYADAWLTGDATDPSNRLEHWTGDLSAAPSGRRVQYVRVGAGGLLERVVVDLAHGARARVLGHVTSSSRGSRLPPLWSPDGDQLLVVDDARRVKRYDVRTGAVTDLGELPADASTWRW